MDGKRRFHALIVLSIAFFLGALWWLRRDDGDEDGPEDRTAAARDVRDDDAGEDGPATKDLLAGNVDPFKAPRASIAGTVRDEQGNPIADAQVCAVLRDRDLAQFDREQPQCVSTREDGTYRLDEVLGTNHALSAAKRGYLAANYRGRSGLQSSMRSELYLQAGQNRTGIDFVLVAGGVEVQGVVKDLAGGVVEDAFVSTSPNWRSSTGATYARSDADGRFTLWVAGPEVFIRAWAEGYAAGARSAAVPGTFVEVFMTPESVVVGTVVWAETEQPVEGARVRVRGSFRSSRGATAVTDAEGRFRLDGLEPGSYKLAVIGEELQGLADELVHVGMGQTSEPIVIRAHRAYSVRGMVLIDGEDPCSYATVRLEDPTHKSEGSRSNRESEDGSVLVEGLLPGTYQVSVSCEGYLTEDQYPDVVITDASVDGLVWAVHVGQSIRGKVVDDAGQPIEKANVRARMTTGEDPRGRRVNSTSELTEADGVFEIKALLPGTYEVIASHNNRPSPDQPTEVVVPAQGDVSDLVLTLPTAGTVTGTVRGDDGKPVASARVTLRGGRWGGGSQTNDEGRFVIEGATPGDYRALARRGWSEQMRAPGASDDDVAGEPVVVRAGETTEVDLVVESQSGRITGRVLDESGEPVADAFVSATRESDSAAASSGGQRGMARWGSFDRQPVLTDEDGRFELTDLADKASYTVHANRKGGGEALAEHVATGSDVTLSVGETGVLAGVVRLSSGGSPERFTVSAADRANNQWSDDTFLRTNGQWRLSNLGPGSYEITVEAAEGSAKTTVELGEGDQKTDVVIELVPRITVRGRLVDSETHEPVPGLKVSIGAEGGSFGFSFGDNRPDQKDVSDADGRFEVEDAPAGKVGIFVAERSFAAGGYGWTRLTRKLPASPAVQDIGTIEVVKPRVARGEAQGDLGFVRKEQEPGTEPEQVRHVVAVVRPGGPAAQAGLAVGDEIVAVDGQKVVGEESYRYYALTRVKEGTTVKLELASGREVSITAGPQP